MGWLYRHLHLRKRSPLTRLQREMLATVVNGKVGGAGDFDELRSAGWDEDGIYEATALRGLFNFSGRLEAASGLLQDTIAEGARPAEVRA